MAGIGRIPHSATFTLPFVLHTRSQVVRSNDVARTILERFQTQSSGIADVRLEGNAWVLDPEQHHRWNLLLGLGFDAPTGADDAQDVFEVYDPATKTIKGERRTVDQSIQPGDGGWGITLDLYSYFTIMPKLNAYLNGAYTFTPEEKNGVPTYRSNPFEAEMSIADSYMGRAGVEYALWPKYGLSFSLGGRVEGVPVEDAIGGSDGFRRPGYAVSIEPGVSAMYNGWAASLYTPVAVYRNREQSVPDKHSPNRPECIGKVTRLLPISPFYSAWQRTLRFPRGCCCDQRGLGDSAKAFLFIKAGGPKSGSNAIRLASD